MQKEDYYVDYGSKSSINNLMTAFDLSCESPYFVTLFPMAFYIGLVVSNLIAIFFMDSFGKVNLLRVLSFVTIANTALIILGISNIYMILFAIFIFGILSHII